MTDQPPTLWISLELDPGTAAFFGLPTRLSVPDDPEAPFLGGYDTHLSLTALASGLEKAVGLNPDLSARADVHRFVRRWPRYADLDRYLKMGNATFARTVANGLLEDDRHDPPPLAALALLSAQDGKWSEAVDLLERVRERAPTYGPARLSYALCLAGAGREADALEHLSALARRGRVQSLARLWKYELQKNRAASDPDRLRGAMKGMFGLQGHGDPEEEWRALSEVFPGNPEILFARTVRPGGCRDDAEREQVLEAAVAADPDHIPATASLCGLYRRRGRPEQALSLLDAALERVLDSPVLQSARGETLEQLGRTEQALDAYRAIFDQPLALLPGSAVLIAGQGLLRLGADEAKRLLEDAAEARPGDSLAHQLLARWDESGPGGKAAAEHRLRRALQTCGPLPHLQYTLGDLLRRSDRLVEAEGLFKALLRRFPRSPWGHRGLGDLKVEHEPARALEHYAEAVRIDPTTPIAGFDYLAGVAALREGDLDAARDRLQRAVATEPDNPRYWCDLGAVFFYLGRIEQAMAMTERALDLSPGHPGFLHNLSEYHRARFRRNPFRHPKSWWTARRLQREVAKAKERGWRRDLWSLGETPEETRATPPPV